MNGLSIEPGGLGRVLMGVALWGVVLASPEPSSAISLSTSDLAQPAGGTRTSEGGQVTISVTWPGDSTDLAFKVVMDTHVVNLDAYDLAQLAVLRMDNGAEIRPSAWDAPPGGHHREGVLAFPSTGDDGNPLIEPDRGGFELVIRDVAGVPERTLRWEADGGGWHT